MGCGSSSDSSLVEHQHQPSPHPPPAVGVRSTSAAQVVAVPADTAQKYHQVKQAFQEQPGQSGGAPQEEPNTNKVTPQPKQCVQEKPTSLAPTPMVKQMVVDEEETAPVGEVLVSPPPPAASEKLTSKNARELSKEKSVTMDAALPGENEEGSSPPQEATNAPEEVKAEEPTPLSDAATSVTSGASEALSASLSPTEPEPVPVAASSSAPSVQSITDEIAACNEGDLFVLKLTGSETDEQLSVVHEFNQSCVKVSDVKAGGPGVLNESIIALSWRWDIAKPKTLEEAKKLKPSPKILEAIRRARASGFKWAWIDWMVVPQYPTEPGVTINHVRGSRLVYEKCSVMIVDLIEVVKGVKAPTPDYISRLWTTAEMSSMLSNPNVNYSTFVHLEKLNHVSITTAAMAIFTGNNSNRDNYVSEYMTYFQDKKYESQNLTQDSIHIVCYNLGLMYLSEKYGRNLPMWLCSNFTHLSHREPVPLTEAEQEKLIDDYYKSGQKGHTNEFIKPILDAVAKTKKMPKNFDFTAHYRGYLLLASEVIRHLSTKWKFNQGCYKSILQRLGETFYNASTSSMTENDRLKCFSEADVSSVREMIMAARSRVKVPIALKGLTFHQVPLNHMFTTPYLIPNAKAPGESIASFKNILPNCTFLSSPSLDDAAQPLRSISLSCQASEFTRGLITNVDFYSPQCRIGFIVQPTGDCTALMVCDEPSTFQRCALKQYDGGSTLGADELWFDMHFTYMDSAFTSKTLSLSLKTKLMTMAQLLQVEQGFETMVQDLLKSCTTEADKLKAVQDVSHQLALQRICDAAGLITTSVPAYILPEDTRPEYTAEEAAEMEAAAKAKAIADAKKAQEAIERANQRAALGLPEEPSEEEEMEEMCKKFNLTPATLKLMPESAVEQLKSSWAMMKNVKF